MKNNIIILPGEVANQIAAGEVAERPSLVIKELVENSIDANAAKIKIDLKESGQRQIRVTDDGEGIPPADLPLAFARHGTSKLRQIDDLNHLATMGFRGEALASIAAVSKVRMTTRTAESDFGYCCEVIDGAVGRPVKAAANVGTEVVVDELFYNTPARRRFMASPAAEMREIIDLVGKLIIAQPTIAFELTNDGKRHLFSPGQGGVQVAIMSVYGKELSDRLLPVVSEQFQGYVSHPAFHKPNRSYYHFYLNGRYIRNEQLNRSLEEAYHTLIPDRRFPAAFIDIQIEPTEYDVNVHPNKLAVKFKSNSRIPADLTDAVRASLLGAERAYDQTGEPVTTLKSPPMPPIAARETSAKQSATTAVPPPIEKPPVFVVRDYDIKSTMSSQPAGERGGETAVPTHKPVSPQEPAIPFAPGFYSALTILGQWAGSFIVAGDEEALYLIDQHAAHERLLYNRIRAEMESRQAEGQPLLVPLEWRVNSRQYAWLLENIVNLRDLGFILEDFGDELLIVRAIPAWAADIDVIAFLTDYADGWLASGKSFTKSHILDHKMMSRACKSAVKANQHLTVSDIRFLFAALDETADGFTCPHGRPITIKYTMAEVRRRFLRT